MVVDALVVVLLGRSSAVWKKDARGDGMRGTALKLSISGVSGRGRRQSLKVKQQVPLSACRGNECIQREGERVKL